MEEDSHDAEDEFKGSSFRWTDELANTMIELCITYQRRNGKKQLFKWGDMAAEFGEIVGMKCTKVSLKNKFESMKREYKAWRLLLIADPAMRWDPITRRINADNDWWNKKIKENKNCKRFRNKGMDSKLEELWERLYSGNYDDDDDDNDESSENPTGIDRNTVRRNDFQRQPSCSSKRAKRKFEDRYASERAKNGKIASIFEEQATSTGNPRTELQEGLVVIANMVKGGMLEETSPLWCYAVSLNKRKNHRETILNLSSDVSRLAYLKWEFARDVADG